MLPELIRSSSSSSSTCRPRRGRHVYQISDVYRNEGMATRRPAVPSKT